MRLPRPRFTVRRLMVAVAIAGLAAWSVRRDATFRRLADLHRGGLESAYPRPRGLYIETKRTPRGEWHRAMMRKYDRAARYPWLPVAPDPPEPE